MKYPIALICAICCAVSCHIDHGLGTLHSQITGQIIFLNPDSKPDFVESVRIVAAVRFPPQTLGDVVFTNTSINLSKAQPDYTLPAPLASYQIVAAVWKAKGKNWDYRNILGFYGFDPVNSQFEYKPVELTKADPVAQNIDIYCDWTMVMQAQE
jgi:hypothetical protein